MRRQFSTTVSYILCKNFMIIFLVEIDRFGFETEQSGKLLIDTVIWILNRRFYWNMCPNDFTHNPREAFHIFKIIGSVP